MYYVCGTHVYPELFHFSPSFSCKMVWTAILGRVVSFEQHKHTPNNYPNDSYSLANNKCSKFPV